MGMVYLGLYILAILIYSYCIVVLFKDNNPAPLLTMMITLFSIAVVLGGVFIYSLGGN